MPGTINHILTATTPDDPAYEIRPSHWNSAHAVTINAAGSEISGAFSNANGASFGLSGTALTLSYTVPSVAAFLTTAMLSNASTAFAGIGETTSTQAGTALGLTVDTAGVNIAYPNWLTTAQAPGAYLTTARASNDGVGLNTAQTNVTWTVNSSGISINAAGYAGTGTSATNASVTLNSNGLAISVAAPGAGGGAALKGSGTYTQNTGTVEFANSNGITFGLSNNGTMTASHNGITTGRASNDAIGLNTALTANGVAWTVNSSGISLNVPAFLTTAALSNHSHGNPQLNLTNLTGTTASNSAGFTLSLSAAAPGAGGMTALPVSASGGEIIVDTLHFFNSNGITFGTAINIVEGISASHNGLTTAAQSNHSHGNPTLALTNLSGTTASASNGFTLSLAAGNYLTTARASNDAVGLNTAATNVTWTVNSSGISVNAAGYAGTGTTFAGANISASMTLNSNGMNMSASVAAPGGGAANTVSYYANAWQFMNSQTMTFLQSTSHVLPFVVDQNVSFDYMRVAASGAVLAASSTAATTGNTSYTAGHFRSHNIVIYSRGAGANSLSLQYYTSTQVVEAFRLTQSHAANSTQHSYTLNYSFPCYSGVTGFTKNYSSSAASLNYHTSQLTDLTGIKMLEIPFAGSLSPGRYWMAYGVSSTTSTQRTADQSRQGVAFTFLGMSQGTLAFGNLGSATNSSVMPFQPSGSFTTAGGGTTASIPFSAVSSSASQNQLFFQLMRVT